MSGCADPLWAICDADRQFFQRHPRRMHRTRGCTIEEAERMVPAGAPLAPVYSELIQRREKNKGMRKILVPEVVPPNLPEKRAAAVWKFWAGMGPDGWGEPAAELASS